MKQLSLIPRINTAKPFIIRTGLRKSKRPLSSRHPIHLILKSAKHDLRAREREIVAILNHFAAKFGIKIYGIVVNSDHIHAIIRLHHVKIYNSFIRSLTGTLTLKMKIRWLARPVTRIANWGRDFRRLKLYLKLNWLEATGQIAYQPNRTKGWSPPYGKFSCFQVIAARMRASPLG